MPLSIVDIRRGNLRHYVKEMGGSREFIAKYAHLYDGTLSDSYLSQLLSGKSSFGAQTARKLEIAMGLAVNALDHEPTFRKNALMDNLLNRQVVSRIPHIASENSYSSLHPILAWEHPDDLPEGEYVQIPRLEIQLSAGHGSDQIEIEFVKQQPQAFRTEWIRKKRLKPAKLACMYASGDSMEDRIFDGDSLVIDTGDITVVDGRVYALWYDGGERVKRLYRRPGGGLLIRSDNERKYPEIILTADEAEHVRIIGRVAQVSGDQGL
jgi:phage repressor protein C with HTH and peptisase S24 domain